MNNLAIKNCPCCQQAASLEKRSGGQKITGGKWYRERVYCRNKKCGMTTATFNQPNKAVLAWNLRTCEICDYLSGHE